MSVNVISGRVVLKESGLGIPDLLVVIFDADPGSASEDTRTTAENGSNEAVRRSGRTRRTARASRLDVVGDRLGSRLTDAAGAFSFTFEDDEFQIRNADERRPDLHLAVLAPEEPGKAAAERVLYTSAEIRHDAGRTEQYFIRLPGKVLSDAGVALPRESVLRGDDAVGLIDELEDATEREAQIRGRARKLAKKRVDDARKETKRIDDAVERRIVESLTGYTVAEARRLNIALPGDSTEAVAWRGVTRSIDKVNGKKPVTGYLVVSAEEASRFKTDKNRWRSDIRAEEIEHLLFRSADANGRPTFLTRTAHPDAPRPDTKDDPFAAPTVGNGAAVTSSTATTTSSPTAPNATATTPTTGDDEATELDLPRLVGRLVNEMQPPEVIVGQANTVPEGDTESVGKRRPEAADIEASITQLRLASGPSDVTAFHDYHSLQIAFDHVWKQFVDEDVIETGKTLARAIADSGGDPVSAVRDAQDPISALKLETTYIARANGGLTKRPNDPFSGLVVKGDPSGPSTPPTPQPGFGSKGGVVDRPPEPSGVDTSPPYAHYLLGELDAMLNERYKFEVFAPGSTNFGLLVTYRQKWEPITYQAGDLVYTLTLAPKETRKVTTRRTIKRERAVKEAETNLRNRTDESKTTMRADAEVVDRASTKTNFNLNAKGNYNIGIASGDSTMTIDRTAEASSQETKKSFHENVLSAAMQLRSEKTWSFESKDTFEEETIETSEITNPNDELTVTYLFYELERRYRVSEHLHRLTPVILVGMEVPNPGRQAIDRILLAHSWIINRVLLDDRYRAPLEYLCSRIVGDELGLNQLATNVTEVRAAVAQLTALHRSSEAARVQREAELTAAIRRRAERVAGSNDEGAAEKAWEWVVGEGDDEDVDSARIVEDMSKEAYERAVVEEKELRTRLDAETAALTAANQTYAKAYADHMNRMMEVGGLRAHFKENVLYYMQAIWSFTFQDQTFFSLVNVKAPSLDDHTTTYSVRQPTDPPISVVAPPGSIVLEVRADLTLNSSITVESDAVTLAEIAELDRPLGFKGNYMIFPLRNSNPLTDWMMVPYVDAELGLHDPDQLDAWAPAEFVRYARDLLEKVKDDGERAALEKRLREQYTHIVSSPRRLVDEIVVPTDSLFIEALPGSHALLEDFKLDHRQMDVEKAKEEARRLKLENLRYAARILGNQLEDPEVDRRIVIEGSNDGVLVPTEI